MFKLTIEDDEGKTTVVPLARDEITIGRLEGNTIRLTERNVSRRHARLVRQNGALYIEDLASFTGVRVNGTRSRRRRRCTTATRSRSVITGWPFAASVRANDRCDHRSADDAEHARHLRADGDGGRIGRDPDARVRRGHGRPAGRRCCADRRGTGRARRDAAGGHGAARQRGFARGRADARASADLTPPEAASPAAAQARRSQPQPVATPSPQPVPVPPPLGGHTPGLPRVHARHGEAGAAAAQAAPGRAAQAQAVAGVPDVSDAQPTIPIRALGETVPDRTAGTAPARMFVLTTDLAGLEFQLDRASAVIGRTDENDVVLGHRSISRHHAKIVRDGDHYTIVDLQSANGVRVNGEDYERIELNPGDIIELGHVKLRFVGPFETFVFRRASAGMRLHKLAAGAAVGLVALAAVVVVLRKRNAAEAPPPVVAVAPEPAAAPPPAPSPHRRSLPRRRPRSPRRRPRSSRRPVRPSASRTGTRRARRWTS